MTKLDDLDHRLIDELRNDSRTPVTVLSRRLGIPRVTIQYRLGRLRKSGAIRKFTLLMNRQVEGMSITAFTLVNLVPGAVDQRVVGRSISRLPGVVEVHDITGRPDFIVKLRAASIQELGDRVNRVRRSRGVGNTETLTCVQTYKEEP
jgi:Lrp/AsnC family transcriptional regulator, leucine-responsive regulatory protein